MTLRAMWLGAIDVPHRAVPAEKRVETYTVVGVNTTDP